MGTITTTISLTDSEFTLVAADGKNLYGRQWVPYEPMAVVCLVHGIGEHIGRYPHLAEYLANSGFAVYGMDLRGHGHNSGKRGHARCQILWDDLESLMKHSRLNHLDLPIFLYGHSWGGNIVAGFLLRRNTAEVSGAVLSSPWLKLSFEPTKIELLLGKWMSSIYPAFTRSNNLDPASLSRDPSVGEAYLNDPLVHQRISAGLFNDAEINGRYALEHASLITNPVLVMHGTDDSITSYQSSKDFALASSKITLKLWPDMRHETHNEFGKEEVMRYVTKWLLGLTV